MLPIEPVSGPVSAAGDAAVAEATTCWSIPPRGRMRVPARLRGSHATLEEVRGGDTLPQLANVASLPGVVGPVVALPEVQPGYGFPIGAVAAFDARAGGVVVPGGSGYDINCGTRLLRCSLDASELRFRMGILLDDLLRCTLFAPLQLSAAELAAVLAHGAGWAVAHGCGIPADVDPLDWRGTVPNADPRVVSERAVARGAGQLGTLGWATTSSRSAASSGSATPRPPPRWASRKARSRC